MIESIKNEKISILDVDDFVFEEGPNKIKVNFLQNSLEHKPDRSEVIQTRIKSRNQCR